MPARKRPITTDDVYRLVTIEDPRISPDGRWIAYVQVNVDRVNNTYLRSLYVVPTDGGKPVPITGSGKDSQPRWSPDGKWLAFTSARKDDKPQIFLLPFDQPGGEARPFTTAAPYLPSGEPVSRYFPNGASNPTWSPDGKWLAFLTPMNTEERRRQDRGIEDRPTPEKFAIAQWQEQRKHDEEKRLDPRWVKKTPYRAGTAYLDDRTNQIVVAAVPADGETAPPRRLTDYDAHHSEPVWTPDGQHILTSRADDPRADEPWRRSHLYRIRVKDGHVTQLTKDDYANADPLPSPDGKWIAYHRIPRELLSLHIDRLAVISAGGGKPRDLNLAMDRSLYVTATRPWSAFKWTADSRALVFMANDWGNTEIYHTEVASGQIEKIIPGAFQAEDIDLGAEGGVAFTAGTPGDPSELFYQAPGADEPQQLTETNAALLDEVIVQPVREMRFRNAEGMELQGWYIMPLGYKKGEKVPLAFNIHGGPHVMWGPSSRTMWHEWQFHAARGYAVFFMNPRGADGYGEDFRMAIRADWGGPDYADLMAGVDAFLAKGSVDEKRIAVSGGSYGGYMTAWVVGHTNRFTCAHAQRGVYNLISMVGTTDIPTFNVDEAGAEIWEDLDLLWRQSPLAYAHQIKTPLMIKAGENDFRVAIEQAEQVYTAMRRSGGTVGFLRY